MHGHLGEHPKQSFHEQLVIGIRTAELPRLASRHITHRQAPRETSVDQPLDVLLSFEVESIHSFLLAHGHLIFSE